MHTVRWLQVLLYNTYYFISTLFIHLHTVFVNGLGDWGSIPVWVISKTQKMVLDTSLLNTQHYKVCIKSKVEQSSERISSSTTPQCSSYWKESLWVALNYSCQFYYIVKKVYVLLINSNNLIQQSFLFEYSLMVLCVTMYH